MVNPDFWKGKQVFITGHTGFKGAWLTLWLHSMGAKLKGYALAPPTTPSLYHVVQLEDSIDSETADIRHFESLLKAVQTFKPEIVFHMAAQPLVRLSYVEPIETYSTNVMGTVHLLEAVKQTGGIKAVVNVTSDKCYENREWVWGYREQEAMGGYDPYSNSKGCAELVTSAYRNAYFNENAYERHGVGLASVRAGNVIGGGDWAKDRLIPDILRAFEQEQKVTIRHPQAIRPWQHVLEPLSGYIEVAQRLYQEGAAFAEGWNFGPREEDAMSVQFIVQALAKCWGGKAAWKKDDSEHPHEAHYLRLDCAKAHTRLSWQPRWTLPETLHRIVSWQKAWRAGENMRLYTLREINDYMNVSLKVDDRD